MPAHPPTDPDTRDVPPTERDECLEDVLDVYDALVRAVAKAHRMPDAATLKWARDALTSFPAHLLERDEPAAPRPCVGEKIEEGDFDRMLGLAG